MAATRPTAAVQDYLKAIYRVEEDTQRLWVTTSACALALGVSAPSASAMLKRLAGLGYVVSGERRGSFALTEVGRAAAREVIRHHRLLETYLVSKLGVPLAEVHGEAEVLEHHISESLEARIAEVLGHPERDPHGSPIPGPDQEPAVLPSRCLADLSVGERTVIGQVDDRDPSLQAGLTACGLVTDVPVELVRRQGADSVWVRLENGDDVHVPIAAAKMVGISSAG